MKKTSKKKFNCSNIKKSLKNKLGKGKFGIVYKLCIENKCYGCKFLTMKKTYELDNTHPVNVEAKFGKALSRTTIPHINSIIKSISCHIDRLQDYNIFKDNEWYIETLKKYKEDTIYPKIKIIINEFADTDLSKYVNQNITSINDHIIFLFYFCYTLTCIQHKYYNFRHNDIKPNNILIKFNEHYKPNTYDLYIIFGIHYYLPCLPYTIKLHDFDYCNCDKFPNQKVHNYYKNNLKNIGANPFINPVYDIHEYINFSLRDFKTLPKNIVDFYKKLIPKNTLGIGGTKTKYCNRYKLTTYHIDKKYNYIPPTMKSAAQLLLELPEFNTFKTKPLNGNIINTYDSKIKYDKATISRKDMFN